MRDKGIQWLLNAQTPSIRYQTLRRLLGRSETDTGMQAVRSEMEIVMTQDRNLVVVL